MMSGIDLTTDLPEIREHTFENQDYQGVMLGGIIYLVLISILFLINEAFSKAQCLKKKQRERRKHTGDDGCDVESNARRPFFIDHYYESGDPISPEYLI